MGLVAPWHVGSSQTRARTLVPCIGRWILNHCATREALGGFSEDLEQTWGCKEDGAGVWAAGGTAGSPVFRVSCFGGTISFLCTRYCFPFVSFSPHLSTFLTGARLLTPARELSLSFGLTLLWGAYLQAITEHGLYNHMGGGVCCYLLFLGFPVLSGNSAF